MLKKCFVANTKIGDGAFQNMEKKSNIWIITKDFGYVASSETLSA